MSLMGRILSWGGRMIPPTPLEKGGNRIGSPPFEGGFRGIELELEATPPTLKYAQFNVNGCRATAPSMIDLE